MNKKKITIVLVIAVLVLCAVVFALSFLNKDKTDDIAVLNQTNQSEKTNVSVSSNENTTQSESKKSENTSVSKTENLSLSEKAANNNDFIKNNCWYYFDDKNTACFVFSFDTSDTVSIAVFNDTNINGEDAEYFSSNFHYAVYDHNIKIKSDGTDLLPKNISMKINGTALLYNGQVLDKHSDLSLEYVLNHFS